LAHIHSIDGQAKAGEEEEEMEMEASILFPQNRFRVSKQRDSSVFGGGAKLSQDESSLLSEALSLPSWSPRCFYCSLILPIWRQTRALAAYLPSLYLFNFSSEAEDWPRMVAADSDALEFITLSPICGRF